MCRLYADRMRRLPNADDRGRLRPQFSITNREDIVRTLTRLAATPATAVELGIGGMTDANPNQGASVELFLCKGVSNQT